MSEQLQITAEKIIIDALQIMPPKTDKAFKIEKAKFCTLETET